MPPHQAMEHGEESGKGQASSKSSRAPAKSNLSNLKRVKSVISIERWSQLAIGIDAGKKGYFAVSPPPMVNDRFEISQLTRINVRGEGLLCKLFDLMSCSEDGRTALKAELLRVLEIAKKMICFNLNQYQKTNRGTIKNYFDKLKMLILN